MTPKAPTTIGTHFLFPHSLDLCLKVFIFPSLAFTMPSIHTCFFVTILRSAYYGLNDGDDITGISLMQYND